MGVDVADASAKQFFTIYEPGHLLVRGDDCLREIDQVTQKGVALSQIAERKIEMSPGVQSRDDTPAGKRPRTGRRITEASVLPKLRSGSKTTASVVRPDTAAWKRKKPGF
jgi:hypothetical protein